MATRPGAGAGAPAPRARGRRGGAGSRPALGWAGRGPGPPPRGLGGVGEARDLGRLWGERDEVVAGELVDAPVAVRLHDRGELPPYGLEEAVDVPGLGLDVVALLVLGVLGGDADDALPDGTLEARNAAAGDDRGRPP